MQTIELLERMVRMQGQICAQLQTIEMMTKTLNLACRRIVDLEHAVERMNGHIASQEILGNTVLPKNKTRGRVIPLSIAARKIARDDV